MIFFFRQPPGQDVRKTWRGWWRWVRKDTTDVRNHKPCVQNLKLILTVSALGEERRAIRTLVVLCAIDFIIFCGYPIPSPFLPGVLEKKGISEEIVGVIFSSMTATMFLLSPFVSVLTKRFSRKVQKSTSNLTPKALFVSSLILEATAIACFAFVDRLEYVPKKYILTS